MTNQGEQACNLMQTAGKSGYIDILRLSYFLAIDETQNSRLLELWSRFELDLRGPKKPDVSTPQARVGAWFTLFLRLSTGKVGGVSSGINIADDPTFPATYQKNRETMQWEKYSGNDGFIRLEDLHDYLKMLGGVHP